MSPRFLFIEEVREALLAGAKVIEVPKGVRITSAARDLIREKGLRVQHIEAPTRDALTPDGETGHGPDPADGSEPDAGTEQDHSEEDIEIIVTRVIDRFLNERTGGKTSIGDAAAPGVDDDLIICRCEEITKGDIKAAIRNGMTTLNGVKRVTRAGMGLCQGQTCGRLVSRILAEELGVGPAEVEPVTARAPVRPIPLWVYATG